MELLKADLLASVSHELRSPLASIKGYAATLLRDDRRISRQERHEFLVAITDASDRLESAINRLLEMSQLEADTMKIEQAPVNLVHLAHEAIIAAERFQQGSNPVYVTITLHVEDSQGCPSSEEPLVQGDQRRLREVFDNLLENAINYSREQSFIEVKIQIQDLQRVHISIQDNGIGIPPEHLERIFENFHRVDTRLIREVNGLGLGLAISKHIVQLHKGEIWAESEPDKGSTFHVLLPMETATSL